MFTQVVELTAKPSKTKKLRDAVIEMILPILKKQRGLQGEITLASDTDPNQMLVLSFWNSREDAERFHCEQFSQIAEMLRPLCKCDPFCGSKLNLRSGTSLPACPTKGRGCQGAMTLNRFGQQSFLATQISCYTSHRRSHHGYTDSACLVTIASPEPIRRPSTLTRDRVFVSSNQAPARMH